MVYIQSFKDSSGHWVDRVFAGPSENVSSQVKNLMNSGDRVEIVTNPHETQTIPYAVYHSGGSSYHVSSSGGTHSNNISSSTKKQSQPVNTLTPAQQSEAKAIASRVNKDELQKRYAQAKNPTLKKVLKQALIEQYHQQAQGSLQYAVNQGMNKNQALNYANTASKRLVQSYNYGINRALTEAALSSQKQIRSSTNKATSVMPPTLTITKKTALTQKKALTQPLPKTGVNAAIGNLLATNFALKNSIAGLNPVSSYLMRNQAIQKLSNAIQKTQLLPSSQLSTPTFFNQNTLHQNKTQKVVNNMTAMELKPFISTINKTVLKANQNVNYINNAITRKQQWIKQHPFQAPIRQAYNQFQQNYKNAKQVLQGKRAIGSAQAQQIYKQAHKDFKGPAGTVAGVVFGFAHDIVTGVASIPIGFAAFGVNSGKTMMKDISASTKKWGIAGLGLGAAKGVAQIGEGFALGLGSWALNLPANAVTQPGYVMGQSLGIALTGKTTNKITQSLDNVGLTKRGRINLALQKLNQEKVRTNIYPRIKENWNDMFLKVNRRGRIVIENAKLQKSAIRVDNSLIAQRDALAKVQNIKPVSAIEFSNVKSMNYPEGLEVFRKQWAQPWHTADIRTKLGDTRLTHTAKPSNVIDYIGKGKGLVKKGTMKLLNDKNAVTGSESGTVWVNTVFGSKPISFVKDFAVNLEKKGKSFVTNRIKLFEKRKKIYNDVSKYAVNTPESPEPFIDTITSQTVNMQLGPQGMRQVRGKLKQTNYNKPNTFNTIQVTTTRLDTTVQPAKVTTFNRITGEKVSEQYYPAKIKLSNNKVSFTQPHLIDLSTSNPNLVKYVKQPVLRQFKDINTQMTGYGVFNPNQLSSNIEVFQEPSAITKIGRSIGSTAKSIAGSKRAQSTLMPQLVSQTEYDLATSRYIPNSVMVYTPSTATIVSKSTETMRDITPTVAKQISSAGNGAIVNSLGLSFVKAVESEKKKLQNTKNIPNQLTGFSIPSKTLFGTQSQQPAIHKALSSTSKSQNSNSKQTPFSLSLFSVSSVPTKSTRSIERQTNILRQGWGRIPKRKTNTITRNIQKNLPITIPKVTMKPIQKTKQIPKQVQITTPVFQPLSLTKTNSLNKLNKILLSIIPKLPLLTIKNRGWAFGGIHLFGGSNKRSIFAKGSNIHQVKPFADLLSISLMDYRLNQKKGLMKYKIAKQPTMKQFPKWKPFFKMTSPVLPTRRMLSSKKKYSNIFGKSKVIKWF